MNVEHIHHSFPTRDRPLSRFLWIVFWCFLWFFGLVISELIIEKLYLH